MNMNMRGIAVDSGQSALTLENKGGFLTGKLD